MYTYAQKNQTIDIAFEGTTMKYTSHLLGWHNQKSKKEQELAKMWRNWNRYT